MRRTIPNELALLAHRTVQRIACNIAADGPEVYSQLIASELYEALKLELSRTPRTEPAKRGFLAAALDHCRRSAKAALSPPLMLCELRATVALLETGMPGFAPPEDLFARHAGRFRVIEGGLSKSA